MADFAKLLSDKMKKATEATRIAGETTGKGTPVPARSAKAPEPPAAAPEAPSAPPEAEPIRNISPAAQESRKKAKPVPVRLGSNTNRVTVNLFDADRRALAIIKEHLANAGHDFTNRSDSIKIALRLAAKAKKEDLAALFLEIRAEDRRFSGTGD